MAFPFEIGKKYKFNTQAPGILGAEYDLMKVVSIMDAESAIRYKDVYTIHEQLSNIIVLPTSAIDCTYILFTDVNGEKNLFALEWLDRDSIKVVEKINVRVDVLGVSTDDISIIRDGLLELGYKNVNISKI